MKAWCVRRKRSTGCGSARGSCCWRRAAWRAGRLGGLSDAQPARPRSGACATPTGGSRVLTRPASEALSRSTRRRRASASWPYWISRRRRAARWTGPLLAAALGDLDVQYVWRFLRAQKIDLAGRKSWCESNDPEFVAKAADVVGLYMAPPENAIVICVDEKIWLPSRRQKSAQPQASLVACGSIPPRSLPPPVACAPGKPWMRWSPTPLGRHQVVRIVRGQKLGVRVVVILLVQRGADALRGASAHMACERHRVHERAAVMHRNVIEEALSDLSCVSVSLLGDIVGISFGSDGVSRRP